MGRISRTIELARASWQVLRADRELILLPVMSWIAGALLLALILGPTALAAPDDLGVVEYVLMGLAYFAVSFVAIFFNAALVVAANERLGGGDPTLRSALRGASARLADIFFWALITATISLVLRVIEQRAGAVGVIVAGLAGFAWTLVTFLVLPVLIIEGKSATESVKRSAALFKGTWGERVASQIGFGLLGVLAAIPGIALIVLGLMVGGAGLIVGVLAGLALIVGAAALIAAMSIVFQTALYHYASTGEGVAAFSTAELRGAFGPK